MTQLSIAIGRVVSEMNWPKDLLQIVAVFIVAGLFFFVLFTAQLLLIIQVERRGAAESRAPSRIQRGSDDASADVGCVTTTLRPDGSKER